MLNELCTSGCASRVTAILGGSVLHAMRAAPMSHRRNRLEAGFLTVKNAAARDADVDRFSDCPGSARLAMQVHGMSVYATRVRRSLVEACQPDCGACEVKPVVGPA